MRIKTERVTSKLRDWRVANGVTLADVAGLTGRSVPSLSRIERGERSLRPLEKIRIARALGVPVGEIFDPEDSPQPDDDLVEGAAQ